MNKVVRKMNNNNKHKVVKEYSAVHNDIMNLNI
jgi:hypothetical protein